MIMTPIAMYRALRDAYRDVPADARDIMVLAFATPLLMLMWMLAPTQDLARGMFSLGIGVVTFGVGWLIETRHPTWVLGYACQAVALGLLIGALDVLLILRVAGVEDALVRDSWRLATGMQQAAMACCWGILAVVRHRWLSRSAAIGGFVASLAGAAWFVAANLAHLMPDPLRSPAQWGTELARSIGGRLGYAWVDPLIGAALILWILWLWHRWHGRDNGSGRPVS